MSGKLRIYKDKLEGYKKFFSIVKTIKMVTLAKFRQSQGRVKTRDYTLRYSEKAFAAPVDEEAAISGATNNLVYIPITSNRGSCGALNSNSYKYIESVLGPKTNVIPVGKRGQDSLFKLYPRECRFSVLHDMKNPMSFAYATFLWESSQTIPNIERTQLQYNRFISAGMQRQAVYNIPNFSKWMEELGTAATTENKRNQFACALLDNEEELVRDFYDFHAALCTLNAVAENELSEQAARLVAVEGQLSNLQSLQQKTLSLYNKTRQGSITASLIEILSAMNSLEGNAAKGVKRTSFW